MTPYDDAEPRRVWKRVRPLLDAELAALPETYRLPILLHHIEGVPPEEASRRLGCRLSAYASRLSRAREMLRKRLVRRGLAITGGALAAAFSAEVAAEEAFAAFVAATAKAGVLAATGGTAALAGSVPAAALELTKGALHLLAAAPLKAGTLAVSIALLPAAGYVAVESLKRGRRNRLPAPRPLRPPRNLEIPAGTPTPR